MASGSEGPQRSRSRSPRGGGGGGGGSASESPECNLAELIGEDSLVAVADLPDEGANDANDAKNRADKIAKKAAEELMMALQPPLQPDNPDKRPWDTMPKTPKLSEVPCPKLPNSTPPAAPILEISPPQPRFEKSLPTTFFHRRTLVKSCFWEPGGPET